MPNRTRVVVCGEKRVAEQCLEFLHQESETTICAIVASPNDWQANLISWGAGRRIKVYVGNINDYYEEIAALAPDFIFSFQYRPLLKRPILDLPAHGCINLHFGLLPRYGGCHPIAWALLNGEKEAGVTLHYMVDKFDEGAIIAQATVPIDDTISARELFDSVTAAAVTLFVETYPKLRDGKIVPVPQDLSGRLYYSKDSINFERDCFIDWNKPATEIQRRIRAFSFEPFQLPMTLVRLPDGNVTPVTVSRTALVQGPANGAPRTAGKVVDVTAQGNLVVATAQDGCIEIGLLDKRSPEEHLMSLGCSFEDVIFANRTSD